MVARSVVLQTSCLTTMCVCLRSWLMCSQPHALMRALSTPRRPCMAQELFSPFGPISRIYIAYDRETGEARGFAFVNFMYKCVFGIFRRPDSFCHACTAPLRAGSLLRLWAGVADLCGIRPGDRRAPRLCLCQLPVQAPLVPFTLDVPCKYAVDLDLAPGLRSMNFVCPCRTLSLSCITCCPHGASVPI